jgi:hypothetical protein
MEVDLSRSKSKGCHSRSEPRPDLESWVKPRSGDIYSPGIENVHSVSTKGSEWKSRLCGETGVPQKQGRQMVALAKCSECEFCRVVRLPRVLVVLNEFRVRSGYVFMCVLFFKVNHADV